MIAKENPEIISRASRGTQERIEVLRHYIRGLAEQLAAEFPKGSTLHLAYYSPESGQLEVVEPARAVGMEIVVGVQYVDRRPAKTVRFVPAGDVAEFRMDG